MTYAEKLRDPRWQKKRLEIMQRDEFTCMVCGETESTLNVHHHYYDKGKDPWDYEDNALITMCEDCHESEKNRRKEIEDLLLDTLKRRGVLKDELLEIARILHDTPLHLSWEVHISILDWWLGNRDNIQYMWDEYFKYIDKIKKEKERKNGKK